MDLDFVSVHKLGKKVKKERGQYPTILTEQTWSIKDLLHGFRRNFLCGICTSSSPERARWLHLARSGSQSQRAIWFILPARGASHIIKFLIVRPTILSYSEASTCSKFCRSPCQPVSKILPYYSSPEGSSLAHCLLSY